MPLIKRNALFIYILLLTGIALSLAQFVFNRSIWVDEAVVAENIIHRTAGQLFKPMDYNGVAPILFLQIEKFFTTICTNTDYALRIFPLLSFWCALFIFARLLMHLFKEQYLVVFALAVFIFNYTTLYYSSEAKQYMSDVLVSVTLYYLVFKSYNKPANQHLLLIIVGVIAVFLSNIAPILLATLGLHKLFNKSKTDFKKLALMFSFWAVAFVVYYLAFIYKHPIQTKMVNYWDNAGGFMPLNGKAFQWLKEHFYGVFYFLFYFGKLFGSILAFLFITGLSRLIYQKQFNLLMLLSLPILLHLLLSVAKLYPFETRLYLYLTPLLIITCTFGILSLSDFLIKRLPKRMLLIKIAAAALLPLGLIRIIFIHGLPFIGHDDMKPCLVYLKNNMKATDDVYVVLAMQLPVKYYTDLQLIRPAKAFINGTYHKEYPQESPTNTLAIKQLKHGVWILKQEAAFNEETFIVADLTNRGYKKVKEFATPTGSKAIYYDKY